MTSTLQDNAGREAGPSARRGVSSVTSLDALVGSHPDALRKIFASGRPTDPGELGDAPRGRILAIEPLAELFLVTRPLVRALANDAMPWKGKVFDHGGNSGQNVILGWQTLRFRAEVSPSELDGRPALVLLYDEPAFKNPWPLRTIRDELRTVGDGVAIGPAAIAIGGSRRVVAWWGLERAAQ